VEVYVLLAAVSNRGKKEVGITNHTVRFEVVLSRLKIEKICGKEFRLSLVWVMLLSSLE
jgi:hypothetical protein